MREIKFRVWSNREMRFPPTLGEWDDSDNHHFFGYNKKPSVIMQYTGLKDKNGKEIWEGDIVRYKVFERFHEQDSKRVSQVAWLNDKAGFFPMSEHTVVEDGFYNYEIEDFEVIGNIYENKELLDALHE